MIVGFIIGVFVGCGFGVLIIALLNAGKDDR